MSRNCHFCPLECTKHAYWLLTTRKIIARYGLLAASEALRHGGVSVTARHYIENKQRSVLGFGHLLKSEERTVVPLTAKGL